MDVTQNNHSCRRIKNKIRENKERNWNGLPDTPTNSRSNGDSVLFMILAIIHGSVCSLPQKTDDFFAAYAGLTTHDAKETVSSRVGFVHLLFHGRCAARCQNTIIVGHLIGCEGYCFVCRRCLWTPDPDCEDGSRVLTRRCPLSSSIALRRITRW
jgi:hypothetical protein